LTISHRVSKVDLNALLATHPLGLLLLLVSTLGLGGSGLGSLSGSLGGGRGLGSSRLGSLYNAKDERIRI